jgi:hypothetical protein
MHHDRHPGKADSDGNQAVPPDPFVQQGTGKRCHEERGEEENGDGSGRVEDISVRRN